MLPGVDDYQAPLSGELKNRANFTRSIQRRAEVVKGMSPEELKAMVLEQAGSYDGFAEERAALIKKRNDATSTEEERAAAQQLRKLNTEYRQRIARAFDEGPDAGAMMMSGESPQAPTDMMERRKPGKKGKRWGWRSDPESKAIGLGLLRRAYAHGGIINHSEKALDEALMYITFPTGSIGPAELLEESSGNRASHGDRVIANMLCLIGGGNVKRHTSADDEPNRASQAKRFKDYQRRLRTKAKNQDKTFDFSGAR